MNAPEKQFAEIAWSDPIEVTIDFKRKNLISPERALIDCGINDLGKHLKTPLGVVCYGQRRIGAKDNPRTWSINPNTLIKERRAVIVALIAWLCENYSSASVNSKYIYIVNFRAVFDWIDKEYLIGGDASINFQSIESLKTMYVAFSNHLKHLVLLGQKASNNIKARGMTNKSAKNYQVAARCIIIACSGLDEEIIKNWAEVIRERDNSYAVRKSTNDNEIKLFHHHLIEVIEAYYQIYVLENPSVIDSKKWGWLTGMRTDFDKRGHHSMTSESNHKVFALVGFYFMVLATGQNESVLLGLKANETELNRLNNTTYRVGKKTRAKGKEVIIEMGSEHKLIFDKYLEVRNLIAPSNNTFLFPDFSVEIDKAVHSRKRFSSLWKDALGGKVFKSQALRRFFSRKIGQVAQSMGSQSGELNGIIALMLQNKPLTACQYSIETLEQAAAPLSKFLLDLHNACIKRGRTQQTIRIDPKLHRDKDRSTPTGACESEGGLNPRLADGFSDSVVQPSCGKWETCLFCEHYGVHADEIDLKKLLSLKAVVEILHQGMDEGEYANRFAFLLARIQEVIDEMLIKNPSLIKEFQAILDACEAGELDDFWAGYMRTLKLNGFKPGDTI